MDANGFRSLRSPIHLKEIYFVTALKEILPFKLLVLTKLVPSSTAQAKTEKGKPVLSCTPVA